MAKKNVIMFTIDDLRSTADWGHFASLVKTPNLDRLMEQGTTFERAINQVPLCNPSRSSVFTGQSPSHTGILDNTIPWYDRVDPSETLPAVLRDAGAYVAMYGKNFHEVSSDLEQTLFDDYFQTKVDWTPGQLIKSDMSHSAPFRSSYYGGPDNLRDARIADHAVSFLENQAPALSKPFFLAVGLSKPHLDWVVPKSFYDLYDEDEIRAALNQSLSDGTIIPGRGELTDVPGMNGPMYDSVNADLDLWVDYIHAYLASVTYADSKIGKVLNALEADPELRSDTSIILWSDNGYHLGDKNRWEKTTPWRAATEVPLVIVDPDKPGGQVAKQIVSLTDIYPTVLDMMDVSKPRDLDLAGSSLLPIVANRNLSWHDPDSGKGLALSMVYGAVSLRADVPGQGDFRYTLYPDGTQELYDITRDPDEHTNRLNYHTGAGLTARDNTILAAMKALFQERVADAHIHLSTGKASLSGSSVDDLFVSTKYEGTNSFAGGNGDDTYILYRNATVTEKAGGGFDSVTLLNPAMEAKFVIPTNVEMVQVARYAVGNASDNWIYATGRSGTLSGLAGNDHLRAGKGDGFVVDGGTGNDELLGRNGADTLRGGDGNDTVTAGEQSDLLEGGAGADILSGESGRDTLVGGLGSDRLTGGAERDVFRFLTSSDSSAKSSDVVTDFVGAGPVTGDVIDLSAIDANDRLQGNQAFVIGGQSAGHLRITEDQGNTVIIGNTDADTASEFRLVIADGSVHATDYNAADFIL